MGKFEVRDTRFRLQSNERCVDVVFHYENAKSFSTSIPVLYRRTGTDIPEDGIDNYLHKVYEEVDPKNWGNWKVEQDEFWNNKPDAAVTKSFFDVLCKSFEWTCVSCDFPDNPNWARRVQDIKEFGYTLATQTKRPCLKCNKKLTHLILIPIKRGGITGYETWSKKLRSKIVSLLKGYDVYEAKSGRKEGLLPDHKFPEIRWDKDTRRHSLEELTDEEIKNDFQLLTNQRNQHKREVCRGCFQTGKRGIIYGIPFFYQGTDTWDEKIPKCGKAAEVGCIGCGWYDINKWREELSKKLKE